MPTTRNTVVRARVNEDLKHDVENILSRLGLNMSDAINALFSQIKLNKGLPFDLSIPNRTTAKAIRETREGKGLIVCDDADDMFGKIGI